MYGEGGMVKQCYHEPSTFGLMVTLFQTFSLKNKTKKKQYTTQNKILNARDITVDVSFI